MRKEVTSNSHPLSKCCLWQRAYCMTSQSYIRQVAMVRHEDLLESTWGHSNFHNTCARGSKKLFRYKWLFHFWSRTNKIPTTLSLEIEWFCLHIWRIRLWQTFCPIRISIESQGSLFEVIQQTPTQSDVLLKWAHTSSIPLAIRRFPSKKSPKGR